MLPAWHFRGPFVFGDVPTWLAFGGAAIAVYYTHRLAEREQDRDEERARREREGQANLVAAWDFWKPPRVPNPAFPMMLDGGVMIRNASPVPIYDVELFSFQPTGDDDDPPGEKAYHHFLHTVGSTDEAIWHETPTGGLDYAISFRDAAAVRWWRDPKGLLHEGRCPWTAWDDFEDVDLY